MLAQDQTANFQNISLTLISVAPYNARRFEENMTPEREAKFRELVDSVREKGILQPIAVRPKGEGFEIMAGERRFRAACEVAKESGGIGTIPAMIYDVDDDTAFDIMTTENLQREDLSPVEKAQSFKAALDRAGNTLDAVKDLSRRFGIAPHAIRLQAALLTLPKAVLDAWDGGQISTAHAEQLTRLHQEPAILSALAECLRCRMTVAELTGFIQAQKPPMKTARFDPAECACCESNSSLQGSLFGSGSDEGCCLNPSCFKEKQGAFFRDNWQQGKAKELFGTNSYRFKDDLTAADFRAVEEEPRPRCMECPEFVSVVTLTGNIVKGQGRVCVGAGKCFDELYAKPVAAPVAPAPVEEDEGEMEDGEEAAPKAETPAASAGATPAPSNKAKGESVPDEKKALRRGEEYREKFYETALAEKMKAQVPSSPQAVALYLVALALESSNARDLLAEKLGLSRYSTATDKEKLVAAIFTLPVEGLLPRLLEMAVLPIMNTATFNGPSSAKVRDAVALGLGIDLQKEFVITRPYLESMSKAEIVAMGEEEGTGLWKDEAIKAYKEKHHAKKGWMSLKKSELVDCVLESGADLSGKVPEEIFAKGRAA